MDVNKRIYFNISVVREWKRWKNSRTLHFITIIGPLISFILAAWIFSSNIPRELPVAIVDMDNTSMSRQIARMIDATPIAKINRNFENLKVAQFALESGDIEGIIFIPKYTEKDVFQGKGSTIALYFNNGNVLKGGLLNSGVRKAISTYSSAIKLQMQLKSGLTYNQSISRIMPVQLSQVLLFNPFTSYSYYLTAALMPVLLIVFVLIGSIYVIGDELYRGTGPNWIQNGGGNFLIALLGKLLPYTFLYFIMAIIMDIILFYNLGMPLRGHLVIILLSEFFLIVTYQCFAIFLIGLTSNLRLSLSLGSAYSMLALTYSGLTFPIFGMPVFAQIFSKLLPFTYWIKILISQSLRGEPIMYTVNSFSAFFVFIIFGLLFISRLKNLLLDSKCWGKI